MAEVHSFFYFEKNWKFSPYAERDIYLVPGKRIASIVVLFLVSSFQYEAICRWLKLIVLNAS